MNAGNRLGPYEILAPIGAGGMGEVWRARDSRIGREVAIKVLPQAFSADPDRLRRFEQEARAAGTLNHPNLVTIYDFGSDNGTPYVAMELLEGETLRERIENRLPQRKTIDYAIQIAHGLAAAHEKAIVHRDLKPENIFVTRDGRAKILDFGLAKLRGGDVNSNTETKTEQRQTSPGTVVGTAGYMSPEQVRGEQVDHRSDIFAFGAILYEMLSGRRAFKGDSSVETMNAILKEDPPELSQTEVQVAPAIGLVVRHCLEKNREERFQSAKDLAFDLERISSISGSSASLVASRRRRRWLAPALTALLALIAAVLGWQLGHRATPTTYAARPARKFALMTNQAGVEDFPSLAPDGRTFVYVSRASGNSDIYLKRVDGRNAINLTKDSPADDTMPAFSADGSQIAFRSEREGGGIFLMGATGESVRRLTDFGFNPAWSPDGTEIAVSTQPIELAPHSRPGYGAVDVVTVQNGSRREIVPLGVDGVQPSWSPHGDRIAFWAVFRGGGQRDLYTVDPHAADPKKTIVRLTADPSLEWNPVWSADGKYLYFGSDRDGTMNLWRMPMNEHQGTALGPPEPIALPTRFAAHFTIARNGALAYAGVDLSDSLSRVAFDPVSLRITGEPTPILGGAMQLLMFMGGNVSPDGKWFAFSSLGMREDLFVTRTDGSELRMLTDDPEKDRGASWTPDGKLLYFYSQRGPRYEAWSIRFDGSGLRQVSRTSGQSLWRPRLMKDGRSLYMFNSNGTVILPLNPDGTATRVEPLPPIPDSKNRFQTPAVSPDGKRFVGATGQPDGGGVPGLWLYELATKRYEHLSDRGFFPQWLPDGKRILFFDDGVIAVIDVATKQIRQVPFARKLRGFELTPDGHALILYERTVEADIWLVQ